MRTGERERSSPRCKPTGRSVHGLQVAAAHLTTANIALEHRPKRITPTELTFTYQSTLAGLAIAGVALGVLGTFEAVAPS